MPQLLKENGVSYYLGEKHIYPKGSGGGSATIPIVNHTASSVTISPGVYNLWGTIQSLSLGLAVPEDDTVLNEYMIEFTSGSTPTTLSLPSTIKWAEAPSIEANATYQISIINNLGIIAKFTSVQI